MANGRVDLNLGILKMSKHIVGNNSTRLYLIWVKFDWVMNEFGNILVSHIFMNK